MIDTLLRGGMVVSLAAAAPVGTGFSLWAQWGLAGLVVSFVLWDNTQRERRMNRAIQENNAWVRDTLLAALSKNTRALEHTADSLSRCELRQQDLRGGGA